MVERRAPTFAPCPDCRRHVRVVETSCPFCGAVTEGLRVASVPELRGRSRTGRTLLRLTFGLAATQASACGTAMPSPDPVGASSSSARVASSPSASVVPAAATSAPAPAPSDSVDPVPRRVVAIYGSTVVLFTPRLAFDVGSAKLLPAAEAMIREIVQTLKDHPELGSVIEAHADRLEADPVGLSQRRADVVLGKLVELGVDRSRLRTEALGSSQAVSPGTTEEERAQNRYVGFRATQADGSPLPP